MKSFVSFVFVGFAFLAAQVPAFAAAPAACPAVLHHTFPRLQDEQPQALCQSAVKLLLVVETSAVRGSDANPLVRQLAAPSGRAPLGNLHKSLVGRDGQVTANDSSLTRADDPALLRALQQVLAAR